MDFSENIAKKIIAKAKLTKGNLIDSTYSECQKISVYIIRFIVEERERERKKSR